MDLVRQLHNPGDYAHPHTQGDQLSTAVEKTFRQELAIMLCSGED